MDPKSFKCPECDYFDELDGLRRHCVRKHGIEAEKLYRSLFMGNKEPTCACGCRAIITKFWGIEKGFSKFIRGHHSRVNNNWGHNKDALQKSQDVRRQQIANGTWKVWNRGGDVQSDPRIAAYGVKGSHTLKSDPKCQKQRSEHMAEQWKAGNLTPQIGSDHGMWRGGTSALQPLVRAHLHSQWTYPKLRASGFMCSRCAVPGQQIEVHHDQERFADILYKAIVALGEVVNDDFAQKAAIAEWVADYHVKNNVSGVVLCARCHDLEHASRKIATIEAGAQ